MFQEFFNNLEMTKNGFVSSMIKKALCSKDVNNLSIDIIIMRCLFGVLFFSLISVIG